MGTTTAIETVITLRNGVSHKTWDYRITRKRKPLDFMTPLAYTRKSLRFDTISETGDAASYIQDERTSRFMTWMNELINVQGETPLETKMAYNRAYSYAMGKSEQISKQGHKGLPTADAALGVSFAFLGETFGMIAKRATQMSTAWGHLTSGRFRKFLETLEVKPLQKHRRKRWNRPRQAGSLWLEYWFGWAPAIQDVYDAAETLDSPWPFGSYHGSAMAHVNRLYKYIYAGQVYNDQILTGKIFCRISFRAKVDQPYLYMLNKLGLVNPATVALDAIPWSWLAGWFVNLQAYLDGFTDRLGLQLEDICTTYYLSAKHSTWYWRTGNPASGTWYGSVRCTGMNREAGGLHNPYVVVKMPHRLSWSRAATAVGLLVQRMPSRLPLNWTP